MNKNYLFSTLLIGSALFWQSCGSNDQGQQHAAAAGQMAIPVSTTTVTQEIVSGTKSYAASVVPLQEAHLMAEVSGYVTKIHVADGATVSKGQALYEIDRVRYQAAVDQAKANLEIAKANLQRVEKDLTRYQTLSEQDAIAKQTLDYALTDVNNQKAQVQAAQAALTTAQTNLARSIIRAPFSGAVGISQVRTGALVSPGATLLNTISAIDPIAVEFQISEKEITEFAGYQSGKLATDVTVSLPNNSIYGHNGKIATMDRAVDPTTGRLTIRASFSNPQNELRAGMNVTMHVKSTTATEQLTIPFKAVQDQLGVYNVYVVNDSSQAIARPVELGLKVEDKVVVNSGLEAGERIVVDGIMNVRNGAKVAETPAEQPTPQN